jgi:hypothetical protein
MPVAGSHLDIVGHGRVEITDLSTIRQRNASFYADPVAWLTVSALEQALEQADSSPDITARGTEVGVLAVSDHATLHTMRTVAAGTARGRVSPLRFAGANPGSLAGLSCITFGFHGPTLMLSMSPKAAESVVIHVVSSWLDSGCRYVVVNEHTVDSSGNHIVTSTIVRHNGD